MYRRDRRGYFKTKIHEHRRKMKAKAVAYKGGKCEECGYNKCLAALEFHHREPGGKDFSVSSGSYGWDTIKKEVDKCSLLCCRCHRELHDELMQEEMKKTVEEKAELSRQRKEAQERLAETIRQSRQDKALGKSLAPTNKKKGTWPSVDEVRKLMEEIPLTAVALRVGVSHMSVRAFCEKHGIKTKPAGYWSKVRKLDDDVRS